MGIVRIFDPSGRFFYSLALTTSLAIGALQMFHVRGGVVTDYGADVFGTAWFYAMFRQGRNVLWPGRRLSAGTAAMLVLAGCVASELAQRSSLFPGVFDPLDLVAYAVTLAALYAVDRRFGSRPNQGRSP
jgi:hypothetical protein